MMIMGAEYYQNHVNPDTVFDPNRMAAGIITGIGFLGAGAIMREENVVRGLTTAGCIWFVAGLGIIIGKGLFPLALWGTLLMFIMLVFPVRGRLDAGGKLRRIDDSDEPGKLRGD